MRKFLILFMLMLTTGCTFLEPKLPILDNLVCEPPCWQNIIPGETRKTELFDQLSNISFVDKDSISNVNIPGSAFTNTVYASLYLDKPYRTKLYNYFLDDHVSIISMSGKWHISLAETLEKLGEPQKVVVVRYNGDVYVMFINPEKGTAFGYNSIWKPEKWREEINPDIEIDSIIFFDPNSYQRVFESGIFSFWLLGSDEALNALYPWLGYGELDNKYSLREP